MKSKLDEQVKSVHQTKNQFFALYENSFVILPDGKTIVGVHKKTQNTVIMEDITTNKVTTVGKHENTIYTLLYDKLTGTLFAGDYNGCIVQYRRGNSKNHFSLLKDFGDSGIKAVYSSAQVGRFAFFGGRNHWIVAIDIYERRLCKSKIRSPFYSTFSLQVCHGLNDKVYLSVGGCLRNDHLNRSDFLDVSMVYEKQKMIENQDAPEVNELLTVLDSKDASIKPLIFEIIKLESDSLKEKTQTEGTLNKKRYKKQ